MGNATFLINRNVVVRGHRTSVRLEPDMWAALFDIASKESLTIHQLCDEVAGSRRPGTSFTAALRVFVMNYFRQRSAITTNVDPLVTEARSETAAGYARTA